MFAKKVFLVAVVAILCGVALRKYKAGCKFHYDTERLTTYPTEIGTVLITGANVGLGLETARTLVTLGIHVVLACRNMTLCEAAKESLLKETPVTGVKQLGPVDIEQLNLVSLKSVKETADRVISRYPDLRVLVNNAGIFGAPLSFSPEGVEIHFAVNYLSHFLLTSLLLPHMKKAGERASVNYPNTAPVRVIQVSSRMYEILDDEGINFDAPGFPVTSEGSKDNSSNYHWPLAYGQSKLAIILHARELARREKDQVLSVSLHPGVVGTSIARHNHRYLEYFFTDILTLIATKTPEEGAQPILHCALDHKLSQIPLQQNGAFFVDCEAKKVSWPRVVQQDVDAYAQRLWRFSEELIAKAAIDN